MTVDGTNYFSPTSQPNEIPEDLTDRLPIELIEKIMSELGSMDRQSAILVNKKFSKSVIDHVRKKEESVAQVFVDFLSQNFDPKSQEKIELKNITADHVILKSDNLNQVKENSSQVKQRIINFLIKLKEEDFKNLEDVSKTIEHNKIFKDIFILAKLEKKYLSCVMNEDPSQLDVFFSGLQIEDIHKIVEIIMKSNPQVIEKGEVLDGKEQKTSVLQFLYEKVVEGNQFDEVIEQLPIIFNAIISNNPYGYGFANQIMETTLHHLNQLIVNNGIEPVLKFIYQINDEPIRKKLLTSLMVEDVETVKSYVNKSNFSDSDKKMILGALLK